MTAFTQSKMCKECPFRAKAPAGWLGPWEVEQIHMLIHTTEEHFICHTSIDRMKEKGKSDGEIQDKGQHCVGMLRYMNTVFRQSRDPDRYKAQLRLSKIDDQALIPPFQFRQYHQAGILSKAGFNNA